MKRIVFLMVAVAMLAIAAVPAFAQNFEFEQEAYSGDVVQVYDSSVYGYNNATASDVDFYANTGNYQSQESFYFADNVQYDNADYYYED